MDAPHDETNGTVARVRPRNLIYAVDERPPLPHLLALGLQYAVLVSIYLVLVVIVVRHAHVSRETAVSVVSLATIAAAVGTALALPRGPMGSGFLAPPVYSAIYLAPCVLAAEMGGLPLVFGMTAFAGLVEIVLSFCFASMRVVLQPVLTGFTVFIVGMQLGVVGIGETLDVADEALAAYPLHLVVTTLTLGTCVALSIWGKGVARLFCTLAALVVGMIAAASIGLISSASLHTIATTQLLGMPDLGVVSYDFNVGLAPAFLAGGLAAALRTIGVVTTCQRANDAAWSRPDMANIRNGVRADGLGCLIGGLLGTMGMSVGPSLVGVSSATGATSRAIAFVAAAILFVSAFVPKVAAGFLALPSEVAGAILVFTASFMIAGGMQIMLSRTLDTRAIYVIGIATLLALSKTVFPHYFEDLSPTVRSIASSPLAIGLIAAIGLTLIFRIGTRQRVNLVWVSQTDPIETAAAFIKTTAAGWKVTAAAVDRCVEDAERLLAYLRDLAPGGARAEIGLAFDGIDLVFDLRAAGREPLDAGPRSQGAPVVQDATDNEEAAMIVGLQNFLGTIYADRKRAYRRAGQVGVRLWFAT